MPQNIAKQGNQKDQEWIIQKYVTLIANTFALCVTVAQLALNFLDRPYIIWYLPFVLSFASAMVLIFPFNIMTIKNYWILYNPIAVVIFLHLNVLRNFLVASWICIFILALMIPLQKKNMIQYSFDSLGHTISAITIYGIIRGASAYFVTIGLPKSVSNAVPFLLANIESITMFTCRSKAYTFSVFSLWFFQYTTLKSSAFLALPIIEEYVIIRML